MGGISKEKIEFVDRWNRAVEKRGYSLRKQSWLAKQLGISNDTFRRYVDPTATNKPDIATLIKMANFLQVTTDYLLGLTDVMSPDASVREFCKTTGLSEKAVEKLQESVDKDGTSLAISTLIEQGVFYKDVIVPIVEVMKKQYGQMTNDLAAGKEPITKADVVTHYIKKFNKNKPIIDYETQYDLNKGTIAAMEDSVMHMVCNKTYERFK